MYKTNPKSEQIYTFSSKLHYNSLIKRRLYKAHKNQPQRCEKISHHFAHSNRNPSKKIRPHDQKLKIVVFSQLEAVSEALTMLSVIYGFRGSPKKIAAKSKDPTLGGFQFTPEKTLPTGFENNFCSIRAQKKSNSHRVPFTTFRGSVNN